MNNDCRNCRFFTMDQFSCSPFCVKAKKSCVHKDFENMVGDAILSTPVVPIDGVCPGFEQRKDFIR